MRALVANISHADKGAARDLPLARQIPLLRIGKVVPIRGTILWAMPIVGSLAHIGCGAVGRKALVQIERRFVAAERIAKIDYRIEAVETHPAAPAGVKRLRVKDAVSCPDNRLVIQSIGGAQSRSKASVKYIFRVTLAVAGGSPLAAGIL